MGVLVQRPPGDGVTDAGIDRAHWLHHALLVGRPLNEDVPVHTLEVCGGRVVDDAPMVGAVQGGGTRGNFALGCVQESKTSFLAGLVALRAGRLVALAKVGCLDGVECREGHNPAPKRNAMAVLEAAADEKELGALVNHAGEATDLDLSALVAVAAAGDHHTVVTRGDGGGCKMVVLEKPGVTMGDDGRQVVCIASGSHLEGVAEGGAARDVYGDQAGRATARSDVAEGADSDGRPHSEPHFVFAGVAAQGQRGRLLLSREGDRLHGLNHGEDRPVARGSRSG